MYKQILHASHCCKLLHMHLLTEFSSHQNLRGGLGCSVSIRTLRQEDIKWLAQFKLAGFELRQSDTRNYILKNSGIWSPAQSDFGSGEILILTLPKCTYSSCEMQRVFPVQLLREQNSSK